MNNSILKSSKPATHWHSGYPIGNGKTAAMVSGEPYCERIALNYDTLWRDYSKHHKCYTGKNFKEIQKLCFEKRWDEAQKLILETIPMSSEMLYVSPYVPVGDLYITTNYGEHYIHDYERTLNLESGVTESVCTTRGVTFKKEVISLYKYDVLLVRLSSSKPSSLFGKISMSRLNDPECEISGASDLSGGFMNGRFEEGVEFSVKYRILNRGGRITGYSKEYNSCGEDTSAIENLGTYYNFRNKSEFNSEKGINNHFDSVSELFAVISIADKNDCKAGEKTAEIADKKLERFLSEVNLFEDYEKILEENSKLHFELYNRTRLDLGEKSDFTDDFLLFKAHKEQNIPNVLAEKIFNMGRYLAISSGRPNGYSAPINLQGIWNQDRRPAWESDYHLDLNVEMCYWSLGSANLCELYIPLIDWALSLIEEGKILAKDLYDCGGIFYSVANDLKHLGSPDHMGYAWSGAAAWLAQTMYMYYEYTGDTEVLKNKLYPFMKLVAEFYEDFLYETESGELIPIPSASMEAMIKGREPWSIMSSPSAMDLELIHWLLKTAADTAILLGIDKEKSDKWYIMDKKVPDYGIREDGRLCEHLDNEILDDPGHRHRSGLIGVSPLDTLNFYDTPDLMKAAEKALDFRRANCPTDKIGWEKAWDVELYAGFHNKDMVKKSLYELVSSFMLENCMFTTTNTVSDSSPWFSGVPIIQVDASLGIISGIIKCIVQDRGGVINFLPALPIDWKNGSLCGVLLKGGIETDIYWEDNALKKAVLRLKNDKTVKISLPESFVVLSDNGEVNEIKELNGVKEFNLKAGNYFIDLKG